jgi:ABC-type branched-subunit amino acid transport system substrate-binding protein
MNPPVFTTVRSTVLAACLAAAVVFPATAETGVTSNEIVVGQIITLQGGKNAYGVAAHHGAKLYIDEVNAAGGVHGRRVVLRTLDDDNQGATAQANARKLVQDGAFMLFGSIEGGPSTAIAKVAQEARVPFFGPMAGSPSLRRPHLPMVFPVRAEHREEFRALMTWGQSIGLKTVGFLHADSDTGREHLENVNIIAKALALQVVLPLPFKADATDAQIDLMVQAIARSRPDMLINHGSPGLYQRLIVKARAAGLKTNFMAVNSGSSQIAKGLGPLAGGMMFAQVVPSPWERKSEITREYQAAMRRADANAEFTYGSLEGFLTAKALVLALRAAGRDLTRTGLVKALEGGSFDLGGLSARYRPDEHAGSTFVDLSMVARDGRFLH